ncbi:MAG: hypothetical protein DLM72_03240 [Candidatus Nitrosopolaris wilkensis]|nr:MAG: hypothetical protein DLM72_03240 [Candidatus Nitrosopolaris wilkensis]
MKENDNNDRKNFVFALGFIVVLLVSGTLIGPYVAELSFAQTIQYSSSSFLPSSTSSPLTLSTNVALTNLAFNNHSHNVSPGNTQLDPPPSPSTQAASSSSSASSSSTNASQIQITAGKVQDIGFTIKNNVLFRLVPASIRSLAVSLASQNTSVRILGPSNWDIPTISSGSGQQLTTQVFASTSLIGNPVFFTVTIQYIQLTHQVKTASFNLGAIVVGNIQLRVNNLGIRYIGSTPNLVGSILNEGNTPAQFANVEMLQQGQGRVQTQQSPTSNKDLITILVPISSLYLGNIATNSPVPFSIPLQAVQLPGGKAQQQQNAPFTNNNNPRGSIPPPLLTTTALDQSTSRNFVGIDTNLAPGTYPVSIKITYVDDLKNTRQVIVNSTVNVFGAQSSLAQQAGGSATATGTATDGQLVSQLTSSNGFVDAYWASNTARVANGNGTVSSGSLQSTPVPQQQEVAPGDGQSILAVELSNTEFSNINGITGYLTLPTGFSSATGGIGTTINNINPVSQSSLQNQGHQQQKQVAIATYNSLVQAGQTYTVYFKVNVGKTATLGNHLASLTVYYFKVPNLEPGQYHSQAFTVPFILPGKVILDAIPTTTSLNPGVSQPVKIGIKNKGTGEAHGVIASVTSVSGNSISGSNVGSSSTAASNNVNSTNGPGAQITTITPQSSIPTVQLGARTFDIGTIPVNGSAEIDPIMYPAYSSGGTLQNLNLQISYTNAIGGSITSTSSVGFLVLPTPPQAGITVAPFAGQTLTNNNTSSTPNPNANPGNSNTNNTNTAASGITASPSSRPSSSSSSPSNITNSAPPLSTSSSSSSHSNTTGPSGNNPRNSNSNSSGGITVSPSYTSSSIMPKSIADNNRISNNIAMVPLVYKIAKGNNTGTTTSANTAYTSNKVFSQRTAAIGNSSSNTSDQNSIITSANVAHTSNKGLSHRSAAITKNATASSNTNNQLNSTSLILVAGNTEAMKFNVANNNDLPITNAVVSIASQTSGLKIVGDTLWSLASLGPHSSHQFSSKIFASASLIAQPVSFLVTMQYISHGQSQVGSFILGGTVIGSIKVNASGIGINSIAGVPNLVGNLLNEGNTIALYTTVQLINQPFSTANGSSTTNQQQHQHHHNQSGVGSAGGGQSSSSTTASTTTPQQSSTPTSLPPPQYLGDLQPDSPLPFSIPLTANTNNTATGNYPVNLQVTYSDDLKNSHTVVLNNTVQIAPQQAKQGNGQAGGISGFLSSIFGGGGGGGGGGRHSRGGGQTSGANDVLGIPLPILIAIIAAITIAFILIRRRRRSRAATNANRQEEEGDNEDIESLIDGSHTSVDTKKKEGGGTTPPI